MSAYAYSSIHFKCRKVEQVFTLEFSYEINSFFDDKNRFHYCENPRIQRKTEQCYMLETNFVENASAIEELVVQLFLTFRGFHHNQNFIFFIKIENISLL